MTIFTNEMRIPVPLVYVDEYFVIDHPWTGAYFENVHVLTGKESKKHVLTGKESKKHG